MKELLEQILIRKDSRDSKKLERAAMRNAAFDPWSAEQ